MLFYQTIDTIRLLNRSSNSQTTYSKKSAICFVFVLSWVDSTFLALFHDWLHPCTIFPGVALAVVIQISIEININLSAQKQENQKRKKEANNSEILIGNGYITKSTLLCCCCCCRFFFIGTRVFSFASRCCNTQHNVVFLQTCFVFGFSWKLSELLERKSWSMTNWFIVWEN